MKARVLSLGIALMNLLLVLGPSTKLFPADSPAVLTVRDSGTPLYAQQDRESEPMDRLQKGETLTPMAESVGQEIWYMVRTKQGQIGWVRGSDIAVSPQVKDSFKEKEPVSSNWGAVSEDGKAFGGSYTVDPSSTGKRRAASGPCAMPTAASCCAARGRRKCITPAGTALGERRLKGVAAISPAVGRPNCRQRARFVLPICSNWPPRKW